MEKDAPKIGQRILAGLNSFGCFLIVFLILSHIVFFSGVIKSASGVNPSRYFSVLLIEKTGSVIPYQPSIVSLGELKQAIRQIKDYTFLVPQGFDKKLQAQLKNGYFHVKRMRDGSQQIQVQQPSEGVMYSWYEAQDKTVIPKYEKVWSESGCAMLSILVFIAALILSRMIMKFIRKRVKKNRSVPHISFRREPSKF
ncbi:MAG: hypothetical protein WDL87_02260 [Candidatus Omnitrophota bacterium]